MYGTLLPPAPPAQPKTPSAVPEFYHPPTDVWSCRTHESIGIRGRGRARNAFLINKEAIPALTKAAGGWPELIMQLADTQPSIEVLATMRNLMGVDPYWSEVPYRQPTQQYVADKIREYITWFVTNHGEPRQPVVLTNGVTGEQEIIKEPDKVQEKALEPEDKNPKKGRKGG